MPFSDLFITEKACSTFLNRERLEEEYQTRLACIGDIETTTDFFNCLRYRTAKSGFLVLSPF